MTARSLAVLAVLAGWSVVSPVRGTAGEVPPRPLTFEDRVRAQEAIERVYYSHQIGATLPFEQAVPRAVLEDRVRTYLKLSLALEAYWSTSVTAEALQQELARIARSTRFPDRLLEIYDALGNDPFLIQETIGRATLVERLTRSFFSADATIHEARHLQAQELHAILTAGLLDTGSDHPARSVVTAVRRNPANARRLRSADQETVLEASGTRLTLTPAEFEQLRQTAPEQVGEMGPIVESVDSYFIKVALAEAPGQVTIATFAAPKEDWNTWWSSVSDDLDETQIEAVASGGLPQPMAGTSGPDTGQPDAVAPCSPDDLWDNGSLDDPPDSRFYASTVWTGTEMIVWGGGGVGLPSSTGSRYNPVTDTWAPMSTRNAPTPRTGHSAIWTGSDMVVWGGLEYVPYTGGYVDSGGLYDPLTDTWRPTSLVSAPEPRSSHGAVWIDGLMVIWGGRGGTFSTDLDTGGRYDPSTDTWSATSMNGAPGARYSPKTVAAAGLMLVWGGEWGSGYLAGDGARYDPSADSWAPISLVNAPSLPSASIVWTGEEMIVWGLSASFAVGGRRYNPLTDSWRAVSTVGAPSPRSGHSAVWTGSKMIIWGGAQFHGAGLNTGAGYDPVTDSWSATSTINAPPARSGHSAVWTGSRMIIWGGLDGLTSGGRYDPATNTWTPTAGSLAPEARYGHSSIWTGNEMIVWGGEGGRGNGGRYNPLLDAWTPTSEPPYFIQRSYHTAVWTGDSMILWGGFGGSVDSLFQSTGDIYRPIEDTWSRISTTYGTPEGRVGHTAVWTGSRMIIWGGYNQVGQSANLLNTGGSYDPWSDSWTTLSTVNAPVRRSAHTALWTGNRMIVWGGVLPNGITDSGGLYDPLADVWTAVSMANAPSARVEHTALWTGTQMIVWGGEGHSGALPTGGRYNPASNTWTRTSTLGAPEGRASHTSVWTGQQMIIWGGLTHSANYLNYRVLDSGGRYDPVSDLWRPTSTLNTPEARWSHTAVWSGRQMIVWGGSRSTGGRYGIDLSADADHDLFGVCSGDCDESRQTIFPGAPQICDGLNNDCNDPSWPTAPAGEVDGDGDGARPCHMDCDDSLPTVYVGAPQVCDDGLNNDCSHPRWPALAETNEADDDHDGLTECRSDCDDARASVYPHAPQTCDGINNDCESPLWPVVPPDELDDDQDGFRICQGDCSDMDDRLHPGAVESCNTIDEDCDGLTDEDDAGEDSDGDSVHNLCDNCRLAANPGQEDDVHLNGTGDACDDPDGDNLFDDTDNCEDIANPAQGDRDEDLRGDACDLCPSLYNPMQKEAVACIAPTEDGGQCLDTGLSMRDDVGTGVVRVLADQIVVPDQLTIELMASSCVRYDPMEVFLNGVLLGSVTDSSLTCTCGPPINTLTITDPASLDSLWRPEGGNRFELAKAGTGSPFEGTFVVWVRARMHAASLVRTECLYDFTGGACTANLCEGMFTGEPISAERTIEAPFFGEVEQAASPLSGAEIPGLLDISRMPDGPGRICVEVESAPRLYAGTERAELLLLDPSTAAPTFIGLLPSPIREVEFDDVKRRAFASSGFALSEFDIVTGARIGELFFTELHHEAMEFVDGRLYTATSYPRSELHIISPLSNSSIWLGDTGRPIRGLAFHAASRTMYGVDLTGSTSNLVTLNLGTGLATIVGPMGFSAASLEFGPDGSLYAGAELGRLYRVDRHTGQSTLVGSTGYPHAFASTIVGLTRVAPLRIDCVPFVKQGESLIAINGAGCGPPVALAGADTGVECTSPAGATVALDGSGSTEPESTPGTNDGIVSFEWLEDLGLPSERLLGTEETVDVALPLGRHRVSLRVTDRFGAADVDETMVEVVDSVAPTVTVSADPTLLWPPNHRMVPVSIAGTAVDLCDPAPEVKLSSVTSSDPDDMPGEGDGHTTGDIQVAAPGTDGGEVLLRAERAGGGTGRLYTITVSAVDGSGNASDGRAVSLVPHDLSGSTEPIEIRFSGPTGPGGAISLAWTAVPGASSYNVLRGSLTRLVSAGSFAVIEGGYCVGRQVAGTTLSGAGLQIDPLPGQGFFYLVESFDGKRHSGYGTATGGGEVVVVGGDSCH